MHKLFISVGADSCLCNLYHISFTADPNQKYRFDSGVSFSNRTHYGDSITLTEVVVGAAKSFSCIVIVLWLASHSPVYKKLFTSNFSAARH